MEPNWSKNNKIYLDKIVLNKTKYLTLNSGAMGHKNTSIKKKTLFIHCCHLLKEFLLFNTQVKILKEPMDFSDFPDLQG